MVKLANDNTKKVNIGHMLFKSNFKYYLHVFFKIKLINI